MSDRLFKIIITLCLIGAVITGFMAWRCYQRMQDIAELREMIATDSIE